MHALTHSHKPTTHTQTSLAIEIEFMPNGCRMLEQRALKDVVRRVNKPIRLRTSFQGARATGWLTRFVYVIQLALGFL